MVSVETPWQSGKIGDYVVMLLQWPGFAPFLPLVLYGAISLALWCIRPESAKYFAIRLGIYSGAIVSTQFMLLVMTTTLFATWLAALVAGAILAALVYVVDKLVKRVKRFQIWHILVLTTIVACLSVLLRVLEFDWLELLFLGPFLFIVAAPTLAPLTFVRASVSIAEQQPDLTPPRRWPLYVLSLLVGWLVSWRWAVHIMLDEYSKLPTTNPNCYVSSAAAKGHRRLVGSRENLRNGLVVNDQMRRLKFLELTLQATSPMMHRLLRQIYNRIGPPLARQCRRSIWLADLSYLLLKPSEWIAMVLQVIAGVDEHRVAGIYGRSRE
jgi:hypothetical protein